MGCKGLTQQALFKYKRAIETSIVHRMKHTKTVTVREDIRNGEGSEIDHNIEICLLEEQSCG